MGVLLVPLDSRYTQVGFNIISVQVCMGTISNIETHFEGEAHGIRSIFDCIADGSLTNFIGDPQGQPGQAQNQGPNVGCPECAGVKEAFVRDQHQACMT